MGYLQNNTVVSIRNKEDLSEIWTSLQKGANIMWCDGSLNLSQHPVIRDIDNLHLTLMVNQVVRMKRRVKPSKRKRKIKCAA